MTNRTVHKGVLTLAIAAAVVAPAWAQGLRPNGFVHGDPTAVEYASDFLVHDVTTDATAIEYGLVAPDGGSVEGHNVNGSPQATCVEYCIVA